MFGRHAQVTNQRPSNDLFRSNMKTLRAYPDIKSNADAFGLSRLIASDSIRLLPLLRDDFCVPGSVKDHKIFIRESLFEFHHNTRFIIKATKASSSRFF